ncbi:MAG: hypothetical protein Ct9H300mP12_08010 [Acidimicrobiales bacterium]|nr:MAG: hypothetical protein Ct9H300mP12_08010 [Acidimicrobiales bacterium]
MRSVEYARTHGVRLHVRSAFTWQEGTWVDEEVPEMEQAIVSAVTTTIRGQDDVGWRARPAGVCGDGVPCAGRPRGQRRHDRQNVSTEGVTDISFTVPHADLVRAWNTPAAWLSKWEPVACRRMTPLLG